MSVRAPRVPDSGDLMRRPDRPPVIEKASRRRPAHVEKGSRGRRLDREMAERRGRPFLDRRTAERMRARACGVRFVRDWDGMLPWTGT
jgi:hypothetical protein